MRRVIIVTLVLAAVSASLLLGGRASAKAPPPWHAQLDLPAADLSDVTFASHDVAWATGSGGIFRSEDAGHSWSFVQPTPELMNAVGVAPDGMHGWAGGTFGAMYATSDGGRTWTKQDAGTQINFGSVAALDSDRAIAAGIGSGLSDTPVFPPPHEIVRTDDGGAHWRPIALPDDFSARSIDFLPDGKHGWISAERCLPPAPADGVPANGCASFEDAVLRTTDGGKSWTALDRTESADGIAPSQLRFADETTGWAVITRCPAAGCTSDVERTEDGGKTWQVVRNQGRFGATLAVLGPNDAAVVGAACDIGGCHTMISRTRDAGATWQDVSAIGDSISVLASNGDDWIAAGYSTHEWSSDGRTWHDATFPLTLGSGAFDFIDPQHGWFAASKLLHTDDGGANWAAVSDQTLGDIDFISPGEGWATQLDCSHSCSGFKLLHSTDGGNTWITQLSLPDDQEVGRITFVDAMNGWIEFNERTLHTRDGGATWHDQAPPAVSPDDRRPVVKYVDSHTAFAALTLCDHGFDACVGHTWSSADGGDTWTPRGDYADSRACAVRNVEATDATHVWISGSDCTGENNSVVFRSTDGARSWSKTTLATGNLFGLTFFGPKPGRALAAGPCDDSGCGLRIVRSSDGGATWSIEDIAGGTPSFYTDSAQFASPEHAWELVQRGGGAFSVFGQTLFAYAGIDPTLPPVSQPPIAPPDTGSGPADGGAVHIETPVLLLLAAGVLLLAAGAAVRRRRA